MKHSFSAVPQINAPRSKFDRSFNYKTTFDSQRLIPFFVQEALPGDTFSCRTHGIVRMATPIYPLMDDLVLETFYFSVPNRLVWDNWEKFMGEQQNPSSSIDFVMPKMTSPDPDGYQERTLQDYMGLPTKIPGLTHTSLPMRAYQLIFQEWFKNQNLFTQEPIDTGDGPDDPSLSTLKSANKWHEYFTSCLPFPQKGDPVLLPLGQSAPVVATGTDGAYFLGENSGAEQVLRNDGVDPVLNTEAFLLGKAGAPTAGEEMLLAMEADLTTATSSTVNQIRTAFQVQRFLEKDARAGTRYPEIIMSHFDVRDPQYAVLQRPEYLGGGKSNVSINQVAATTDIDAVGTGTNDVVGALGAYALTNFSGHGFSKSFTEHCYIIGICTVRAPQTYQQGLHRMWSRDTRFDFYFPVFAHHGEQAVLNKEIYAQGSTDPVADDDVFGWQERWAEYRYGNNIVTADMRSNATLSLDAWHLANDFADLPQLNGTFVTTAPPVDRVIATPDEPQFIGDFHHKLICARRMPLYSVPGMIDHF